MARRLESPSVDVHGHGERDEHPGGLITYFQSSSILIISRDNDGPLSVPTVRHNSFLLACKFDDLQTFRTVRDMIGGWVGADYGKFFSAQSKVYELCAGSSIGAYVCSAVPYGTGFGAIVGGFLGRKREIR